MAPELPWSKMSMAQREKEMLHRSLYGLDKSTRDHPRVLHCPRCGNGLHRLDGSNWLKCYCGYEIQSSVGDKIPSRFYSAKSIRKDTHED
jgi:hypothetical protein